MGDPGVAGTMGVAVGGCGVAVGARVGRGGSWLWATLRFSWLSPSQMGPAARTQTSKKKRVLFG